MLGNYLKIAVRRLRREGRHALINMAGLAVGLAAVLTITVFIVGQMSFDEFHHRAEDIYRITYEVLDDDQSNHYASTVPAVGPALSKNFPAVEHAARISNPSVNLSPGDEWYREEAFLWADSTFLAVFDFQVLRGNPAHMLNRPNTVVLSRDAARRYFGSEDPMGQTVEVSFRGQRELEVTGIVENPPANSHIDFDVLSSYSTFTSLLPWFNADNWLLRGSYTYVRLQPGTDVNRLNAQLDEFVKRRLASGDFPDQHRFELHLQPVTDIHLYSNLRAELATTGNADHLYILATIATLILLITGFNYVTLSTARAADRATEIGVRASVGAGRRTLLVQFLGESVGSVLICGSAAVGLTYLMLPFIDSLTGSTYFPGLPGSPAFWGLYGIAVVTLGLLAGLYPAYYLAKLRPTAVFGINNKHDSSGLSLQKALVTGEFALAIVLVAGAAVAYQQMQFVRQADVGYQKENVLVIPHENALNDYLPETIRREFTQIAGVEKASLASHVPTMGTNLNTRVEPVRGAREEAVPVTSYRVDERYLSVLDIRIAEGRGFSKDIASDTSNFLVNRSAAQYFGWQSPVGREIERPNLDGEPLRGRVVGVIEDLHFQSLHHAIEPLVMEYHPYVNRFLVLKTDGTKPSELAPAIEKQWDRMVPGHPFAYTLLSNRYDAQYDRETRLADLTTLFGVLAVFIASLGLFSISALSARRRRKEIGIRKVLGGTAPGIALFLVKEYVILVAAGFVLAVPAAYFGARAWLDSFAYRIDLGPGVFLFAGILTLGVSLLTIGYHAVKAAMINPAEVMRYE